MSIILPRYITLEDVAGPGPDYNSGYLGDKVAITDDSYPNGISVEVATELIATAESDVEYEFLNHVLIPFQTIDGQSWLNLPPFTIARLKSLFIFRACALICDTFYGDVGESNGRDFVKSFNRRFNELVDKSFAKENGLFKYINLPGLALNPMATTKKTIGGVYTGNWGGQMLDIGDYAIRQGNAPNDSLLQPNPNYPYGYPWGADVDCIE